MLLFRERLKELRKEHGYKQEEMAKKLNVTPSAYGYYEQGRNEPSMETLHLIAQTLQVSTDYLLGLVDTKQTPIVYQLSEGLNVSHSELEAVQQMKRSGLLNEVGQNPRTNAQRVQRLWDFIQKELQYND